MARLKLSVLAIGLASACSAARPAQSGVQLGAFLFQGESIPYALFVPSAHGRGQPLPTLLLLHGARGNGPEFMPLWQAFAETNGIVLVAPTLSLTAAQETHVTELLPALLDAALAGLILDPKRTYAFGFSAGGYFAYDAATLLSTRFAAVAVFGMIIAPEYRWIVAQARRKTPIAIYIGDRDQFSTLDQTRATRDLLLNHGFPVHYVELPNQDHAYARVSQAVNEDAWKFMSQTSLP